MVKEECRGALSVSSFVRMAVVKEIMIRGTFTKLLNMKIQDPELCTISLREKACQRAVAGESHVVDGSDFSMW